MTDKQIIIDGVDVSGCKYWKGYCRIASLCDYAGHLCELNPNCYYKQLKRKEEECERTKERLESFQKDYSKLYQVVENKGYIKELDQLKTELEQMTALKDTYFACYHAKHEDLAKKYDELKEENEELKNAFEDIAEARMEICNQCSEKDDYNIPCKQIRDLDYGLRLEIKENDKLKQTLTEIKEIAKPFCEECKEFDDLHKDRDCMYCNYNKILQKISEVENV